MVISPCIQVTLALYSILLTQLAGYASSSNTLYTGAQGSEHSASYTDPGDCATNIDVYPIGTLIYVVVSAGPSSPTTILYPRRASPSYVPVQNQVNLGSHSRQQGLQKYFSVQDSCGDCSSQSQPHFDLWMGAPSYSNQAELETCADGITVTNPTATVIINPNNGYYIDTTPLMSSTGTCDTDADYSRTQPVLVSGGTTNGNGGPTTFSTVVSSAIPSPSGQSGNTEALRLTSVGAGSCDWKHHCQGASCENDNDCGDPFSCVNNVCT